MTTLRIGQGIDGSVSIQFGASGTLTIDSVTLVTILREERRAALDIGIMLLRLRYGLPIGLHDPENRYHQ